MAPQTTRNIVDRLAEELAKPLPGWELQREMSAMVRGNLSPDFGFTQPPVDSSVLILLYEKEDDYYFPLIRRALYDGVHSGQIGLPGGKCEPEDNGIIDTAIREAEEEIGIIGKWVRVIGHLSKLYVQASNFNIQPVVGIYPEVPDYIPDPQEVSEIMECKTGDLLQSGVQKEKELLIRNKYRVVAPYYDVNNQVVWGATAMILSEFIAVLKAII